MKTQISNLIVVIIFFLLILIKDSYLLKASKTTVIEKNLNLILKYKLDDYENLKKINNIKSDYNYKCVTSIKSHNMNSYYKYINLFNNKCDVKKGDIVLNEKGMIGEVTIVKNSDIKVKLITNSSYIISVRIKDTYGTLKNKDGYTYIDDIQNNLDIEKDVVYTSGLTNIPNNIPLGTIRKKSKGKIFVETFVDAIDNPYVLIIGDQI